MAAAVNRSASFRSSRSNDGGATRSQGGQQGHGTAGSERGASLEGAEKFMFMMMRGRSQRSGGAGNDNTDIASETSSQQERKIAALLGGPDANDLLANSPSGALGAAGGPMNVGKRLYVVGMSRLLEKEEKLQSVREQVLMRELSQLTTRPAITKKARLRKPKGRSFADEGQLWVDRKHEHIEQTRMALEEEERRTLQAQPTLDRGSMALVDHLLEDYQGPVSGWEHHFAKFCSKKAAVSTPRELFQPQINSNAVRLDAHKDVGERLFDDSTVRLAKRRELVEKVHESQQKDPNTNRPFFSPQSLRGDREMRSVEELTKNLLEEGKRIERKKEEARKSVVEKPEKCTFSPEINKKSKRLAKKQEGSLDVSQKLTASFVARRLDMNNAPGGGGKDKSPSGGASKGSAKPSSAGAEKVSSPAARAQQQHYVDPNDFLRRTELCEQLRQQRREELTKSVHEELLRPCSFHPKLNRRSVDICEAHAQYGAEELDVLRQELMSSQGGRNSVGTGAGPGAARISKPGSYGTAAVVATTPSSLGLALPDRRDTLLLQPDTDAARNPQTRRHVAIATPRDSEGNAAVVSASVPKVDEYLNTFEQQMQSVLSEWRRIDGPH